MTAQVYLTENDLVLSTENKLLANRLNHQRIAYEYFKLSVDTYVRLAGFRDSSDTTALSLHNIQSSLAGNQTRFQEMTAEYQALFQFPKSPEKQPKHVFDYTLHQIRLKIYEWRQAFNEKFCSYDESRQSETCDIPVLSPGKRRRPDGCTCLHCIIYKCIKQVTVLETN